MAIERILIEGLMPPVSHYTHVVRAGDRVWVSGLVGMRGDGTVPEDTVAQFDIALDALATCLRAVGAGPDQVVMVRLFLTDISERAAINPARKAFFGEHRPASTLVEVSALVDPRMRVEIEAQAVVAASGGLSRRP